MGWAPADALRFPLALSVRLDDLAEAIVCAVARGNLVLAHHAHARTGTLVAGDERWRPVLSTEPLAAGTPPPPTGAPAATCSPSTPAPRCPWWSWPRRAARSGRPRRDLLGGDRFDRGFVIEVERDGRAAARFGDDTFSRRPAPGTPFTARWWTGGGTRGNVGRDVLTTVMTDVSGVTGATNPLPAVGGTDPESLEAVRQYAPSAFPTQERAVTVEDWVEVAERHPEVQRARGAASAGPGRWWTVFLTLDLFGGARLADDPAWRPACRDRLDGFRIAGYDLELRDPVDVPVELRAPRVRRPGDGSAPTSSAGRGGPLEPRRRLRRSRPLPSRPLHLRPTRLRQHHRRRRVGGAGRDRRADRRAAPGRRPAPRRGRGRPAPDRRPRGGAPRQRPERTRARHAPRRPGGWL